jgi:hypothetical protein
MCLIIPFLSLSVVTEAGFDFNDSSQLTYIADEIESILDVDTTDHFVRPPVDLNGDSYDI